MKERGRGGGVISTPDAMLYPLCQRGGGERGEEEKKVLSTEFVKLLLSDLPLVGFVDFGRDDNDNGFEELTTRLVGFVLRLCLDVCHRRIYERVYERKEEEEEEEEEEEKEVEEARSTEGVKGNEVVLEGSERRLVRQIAHKETRQLTDLCILLT